MLFTYGRQGSRLKILHVEKNAHVAGSGRPAVPSRAALGAAGASLLYHMEALPDESRTAWQFSGHDGETSHGENDMNNSHSVNGALGSSAQTGQLDLLASCCRTSSMDN